MNNQGDDMSMSALAKGMMAGEIVGLSGRIGMWQGMHDRVSREYAAEKRLVGVILKEVEELSDGRRQNGFLCVRENKSAREFFRQRYIEWLQTNPSEDERASDDFLDRFRKKIEDEYARSHSSQLRLSMLTPMDQRKRSESRTSAGESRPIARGSEPAAVTPAVAVPSDVADAARLALQLETAQAAFFAEGALTDVLVDEAKSLIEGDRSAAHFSQNREARREFRKDLKRLSDVLRKVSEDQQKQRISEVAQEIKARTRSSKPGPG